MRFRTQLVVGIGALIVLMLSSGVLAVITLTVTSSRGTELTESVIDDLSRVHAVRLRGEQLVTAAHGYLLTGGAPFRTKLEQREAEFEATLASLRGRDRSSDLQAQLVVVEQRFLEYTRATAAAARDRQVETDVRALEATFERQVEPPRVALDEAVSRLVELEREHVAAGAHRSERFIHRFVITILIAWLVGTAICVTLAILVLRRLHRQYTQIEQAEQRATQAAESRKQIVDIVAHDLLSPLNAIVLGLDVMKMHGTAVPQTAAIARAADRMRRLVNDLIDTSRAEHLGFQLERAHHRPEDLLAAVHELFRDKAEHGHVRLLVQAAPELEAFIDRDRIMQVLTNLTGNAIRVARKGDEIVLAAAPHDDGSVRFSVADTGPGIPPEELHDLFAAYRQGAPGKRRGSLGLGLFICKSLVEAHGGQIGVESTPGKGSTFWFDIPAVPAATRGGQSASS
jgi:signal transduction histidine kinase